MTQLTDILRLPQFANKTAQECLDEGNILVSLPKDSTPYTWSGIGQQLISKGLLDFNTWSTFNEKITSLNQDGTPIVKGGVALYNCLNSGGFDFSDTLNRMLIASMEVEEPSWAVAVLEAMLAVGCPQGTTWQLYKVDQPVLDDCTSALATIAAQNETAAQQLAIQTFMYQNINPLLTQNLTAADFKNTLLTSLNNWNLS